MMMTNKEAVNWIINLMADIGKAEHSELWHYEQALKEIKEMLESEFCWTPVSEGLPKEEKETYWVCTDAGTQCECRWTHLWWDSETGWRWHVFDLPYGEKVIAWMNLPEPYDGETK